MTNRRHNEAKPGVVRIDVRVTEDEARALASFAREFSWDLAANITSDSGEAASIVDAIAKVLSGVESVLPPDFEDLRCF